MPKLKRFNSSRADHYAATAATDMPPFTIVRPVGAQRGVDKAIYVAPAEPNWPGPVYIVRKETDIRADTVVAVSRYAVWKGADIALDAEEGDPVYLDFDGRPTLSTRPRCVGVVLAPAELNAVGEVIDPRTPTVLLDTTCSAPGADILTELWERMGALEARLEGAEAFPAQGQTPQESADSAEGDDADE